MCSVVMAENNRYVKPFYYEANTSHQYSLFSTQSFKGLDGMDYSISFYIDREWERQNNNYFSKMTILKNGKVFAEYYNDNTWVQFRANKSVAQIAKVYLVSEKYTVLLLEGMTDFTGRPEISILVIDENGVSLVYNQEHEILDYSESSDICMTLKGEVTDYQNSFNPLTSDSVRITISTKGIFLIDLISGKQSTIFLFENSQPEDK